jgi:hypothetical protein
MTLLDSWQDLDGSDQAVADLPSLSGRYLCVLVADRPSRCSQKLADVLVCPFAGEATTEG